MCIYIYTNTHLESQNGRENHQYMGMSATRHLLAVGSMEGGSGYCVRFNNSRQEGTHGKQWIYTCMYISLYIYIYMYV